MFIEEMKEALNMMLHPDKAAAKTLSVGEAFRFYYRLAVIPLILSIIIGIAVAVAVPAPALPGSAGTLSSMFRLSSGLGIIGGGIAGLLVGLPISMLIAGALLQLFGRHLFKAYKNDFEHTFTGIVKGAYLPTIVLYWLALALPVLSYIFAIWGFIIAIFALAKQQGITKTKSFLVLLGTGVIITIVAALVAIGLVAAFIRPY